MLTEPLTHADLLQPSRQYDAILMPREIPLHTAVFASPDVYVGAFLQQVQAAVGDSIRQDISALERILGKRPPVHVTATGVRRVGDTSEYAFDRFTYSADPERRSVNVYLAGTNIDMDLTRLVEAKRLEPDHPLRKELRAEYAVFSGNNFITWHQHNMHGFGLPVELYFRNFAIVFNNLGLKKVQ